MGYFSEGRDGAREKPTAKIIDGEQFSIITDYLGTPVEMYNAQGEKTWAVEYDIYGKVRKLVEGSLEDCPFRYQGQYEDAETGLYYNRFRYYAADTGTYLSQDPIRLEGNNANFYSHVHDSTSQVDIFGLSECSSNSWNAFQKQHRGSFKSPKEAAIAYRNLKTGKSPWPIGAKPKNGVLKPGSKIRMAMSPGQPSNRPGGWATQDKIPDVDMVRQKLAVTEEFKPTISHVQEYEVIKDLPIKSGTVGPQIDAVTGDYLPGGGSQIQMDVPPIERMNYLKPVNSFPIF